ncbi:YbhB/YbcL family Raf kinase inhibitor-like protein [Qipengyuania algicida]|uniref:YbhB/YbcL family Raf kinase inhibitor-like protein n=1 Tax=Qipengyuania algicida TaxID=1836209 RepID=UPI00301B7856
MSEVVADWLVNAAGVPAGTRGLAADSLGDEKLLGKSGFTLSSPAFSAGGELDPCFTAYEEDAVAPPLEWSAPPPGSQELVLVVESIGPQGGEPVLHWLVWGLAAQKGKLLEGEVPPRTGKNSRGNSEWLLPEPPIGEKHHYIFQLFALDLPLIQMPGAKAADVFAAMRGHVTACAVLTAQFEGEQEESEWDEED